MHGFHAIRTIREKERGHRTLIIALSAGVLKEERERCYAVGLDDGVCLANSITQHARQAVA